MNENEKNHRLLWNELARTGGDDKKEAFRTLGFDEVDGDCFACEDCNECWECPIDWQDINNTIWCDEFCVAEQYSPFKWWEKEESPEIRKIYAHHIANMEWKEGGHHE